MTNARLSQIAQCLHMVKQFSLIAIKVSFPPQVMKNRLQRIFLPSHSLDTVSSSDMLFCFEVLSKELTKEKVVLLRVNQVSQLCYKRFEPNQFHRVFVSWLVYLFSFTSAEASGSQYSYSQVCCLPETTSVRR